MRRFEAIAYDVDGTLVDSFPKHAKAEVLAASHLGVDTDGSDWSDFAGLNRQQLWAHIGQKTAVGWEEFDRIADKYFDTIIDNPLDPLLPIKGADDILAHARRHLQIACQITNGSRSNLNAINAQFGWSGLFNMTVAFGESGHPKPHPDPYRSIYRRLGIAPENTIAVEDSLNGIESACKAGVFTVAIATNLEFDFLKRTNADLVVLDYKQLAFWISNF